YTCTKSQTKEYRQMGRLKDKVAIITGGARGMGATHARRFIEEGSKVVITDLNEEAGQALAKQLGENALFIKQDVTSATDWEHVVAETEQTFSIIIIVVNNAGISVNSSIENMTEEQSRTIVEINQVSVFLGMKYVVSSMMKTENGSIVNISSMNGLVAGA